MVRYCSIIFILLFFVGCISSLPEKGKSIKIGEKVNAPYGYTEMIKRTNE